MLKILFFASLFAALTSLGGEIDCCKLVKPLFIKSLKSKAGSNESFVMIFSGYQRSSCHEEYYKYTVTNSSDIANVSFKSDAIAFDKGKDWLEFTKKKDGSFSLYINGMADRKDERIWHTWHVDLNDSNDAVLVHKAVIPYYALRPGEVHEVLQEKLEVRVERE